MTGLVSITGYAEDADFCPFCGGTRLTYHPQSGECDCSGCGKWFVVMETENPKEES